MGAISDVGPVINERRLPRQPSCDIGMRTNYSTVTLDTYLPLPVVAVRR